MVSIADKLRGRIDIIKATSETGYTLPTLAAAGPIFEPRISQDAKNPYTTGELKQSGDIWDYLDTPLDILNITLTGLNPWASMEERSAAGLGLLPYEFVTETGEKMDIKEWASGLFEAKKQQDQAFKEQAEQNLYGWLLDKSGVDTPELPNLKGIGKWLLIGGGLLAAVYLLGKVLGRKK